MDTPHNILLAFYGDDFTGSTDALEFMASAGAAIVLFIEPPTKEQLSNYARLDAIGVAGITRSMAPVQMERTLSEAFRALKKLNPKHVHYKVCSTFDSSPSVGSIGKAIDTGMEVFQNKFTPLLVAAPSLGRFCVFGNLFAKLGTHEKSKIYRLDRHPSMSKHPVTPADEADLRLHLGQQTLKKTGLIDIIQIKQPALKIQTDIEQLVMDGSEVIFFDALEEAELMQIGELVDEAANTSTLFSTGSSAIEMALGKYWNQQGLLQPVQQWPDPGKVDSLLVICGSCSPVTAAQIKWAKQQNFEEVIIEAETISGNKTELIYAALEKVLRLLKEKKDVIVHTNGTMDKKDSSLSAQQSGTVLGNVAAAAFEKTDLKRIVIAGGDTSGYAARAMGIESVEMIAALVPGAPLCKATAPGSAVDGKEVNFKGGQVGGEDYFGILKRGCK